jgi:Phage tail sheath C-terminal domain
MSESIAEMVLPGTYIEVRSEGLIAVGTIATGNVGIVGTAARGSLGEVIPVGGAAEAIDIFGPPDLVSSPAHTGGPPLSLVRAMSQVFAGGGSNLFAVRIAGGTPTEASHTVAASTGNAFTLTAIEPGSWGNDIRVVVVDGGTAATPRFRLTITYRNQREVYEAANVGTMRLAMTVGRTSQLVTVTDAATNPAAGNALLAASDVNLAGGNSVPLVNATHVADGLALLEDQPINIVLVAGLGADVVAAPLLAHVERTENDDHERIAVVGARSSDSADVLDDAGGIADDRLILVAPGQLVAEPGVDALVEVPPSATAAMVAGRLASIAPHISLTNQVLPITALAQNYSTTVHRNLLQNRVMAVRRRFGHQIVRGISTDPAAFSQISVRRTVDYAKAGVRLGSNPYIGKLNNARVRAALKATLDGFLSQMVLDEMLTAYELEVTATRAQEIRGIAVVTMTLQPTFSIDFIRVTMNLQ